MAAHCWGMMATTEILVEGYNNWRDLTVFVMVLAVDLILLKVAAALMLLDPIQSSMIYSDAVY